MMRNSRTLLISVLISGCASLEASPKAPTKTIGQYYKEAFDRHYAGVDKWTKGVYGLSECFKKNPGVEGVKRCDDEWPPERVLPKDRRNDETISEYMDRKDDEWAEKECFYKGLMQARYIGESQRIEDQCKRDLEIIRLRKAVEKRNKETQR